MIDNFSSICISQNEETADFSAKLLQFLSQDKPRSLGDPEIPREFFMTLFFILCYCLRVFFSRKTTNLTEF